MPFLFGKTWLLIPALAAATMLCACLPLFRARARHMSVRPVTSWAFKSRPIGRFLVDLPEGAVFGHWHQTYGATGPISVAAEVSSEDFQRTVAKRIEDLRAVPHAEGGTQLVESIRMDLPCSETILLWKNKFFKGELIKAESYVLRDNLMYQLNGSTWVDPEQQSSDIRWLNQIFRSLRPLKSDEIPTEFGFCFDHSILVDEPSMEGPETVMATAIWQDHPDVHIRFSTLTNGQTTDPPLLERIQKGSWFSGIRVLRSRRRALASGEVGEEHLERVRERNGTVGHLFVWEAQGLPKFNDDHPQIRLDMSTGNGRQGPEQASLSDQDALRVWDTMVNSIRLRPVVRAGG